VEVGVLALQGDVAEHRDALTDLGVDARPVRRPGDLRGIDGIVMPGGESTTVSMLLESSGLARPLGDALASGMPAFGTCAGLILLARSIEGGRPDQKSYGMIDIDVRRNGFGRQLESFEDDLRVPSLGADPLHAVFIRAPTVERWGDEVEVLASIATRAGETGTGETGTAPSRLGDRQAPETPVLCRQGRVLVAAFHPELTADRRVHELFVSLVDGGRVAAHRDGRAEGRRAAR
jgi:5'-phosphate synthase pdxT subunit